MALLEIKNLSVDFVQSTQVINAVKEVSLSIEKGETLALVGESGSGKSVTALSVLGLLPSSAKLHGQGSVRFDNRELLNAPEADLREIRGNRVGMIFQEPMTSLNPLHTIEKQIRETLMLHQQFSLKKARERVLELLERVEIQDAVKKLQAYPHELSGGQRQRVMIAMALANDPDLLIADEPTSALDVTIQAQIIDLMNDLVHELQSSVMMISHDLGVVAETCDRVAVMYAGSVVEQGRAEDVLHNPRHPYTKGLLRTLPDNASENEDLYSIKGNVPSLFMPQQQCRFAPRCEFSQERCFQEIPGSYQVGNNHSAACFLHENGI